VAEDRSQEQPIKLRVAKRWDGKFLVQLVEYLLHKNACFVELIMLIRVIIETIHAIMFLVMQSFKILRRLYNNYIVCPGTTSITVPRITVRR
jgi:hypothetical protein